MGRACRGKERSDWQLLCKTAELAENTLAVHMHGTMRWFFVGEALVLRKDQRIA